MSANAVSVGSRVSSASRREFRTGSRRASRAGSTSNERIIIIAGLALLAVALLVALARRDRAAPPPAPQETRIVTVPVPMPIERPAPVEPPSPVDRIAPQPAPPAPVIVPVSRPAPVTPAPPVVASAAPKQIATPNETPSAAELAALYRDVGTALQKLDRDRPRSVDDLWERYRWIRLADYLATPDKRAEAASLLTAIASDARRQ
jgi:outer membrane biosynthesis protein TonB